MNVFFSQQYAMLERCVLAFLLSVSMLSESGVSYAASDSAKVISTTIEKTVNKPAISGKARGEKSTLVALINLEEVMPDCHQQVAKAKIKSIQRSESGITTEHITFSMASTILTLPTRMSDNPVLSLDDLMAATQFLKVGNSYFIHYQTCEHTQERSLINIYAM